jgi:hypothetical protein
VESEARLMSEEIQPALIVLVMIFAILAIVVCLLR